VADRREPPAGFAVERVDGAGWVARNPDGHVVTLDQPNRAAAVRVAWDAADTIARMERAVQPGWFACAGDNRVGGPYDTRGEAEARLAELVDDGRYRFHVAYGRRDEHWAFTELPAPS
jgi:hypothetical protein